MLNDFGLKMKYVTRCFGEIHSEFRMIALFWSIFFVKFNTKFGACCEALKRLKYSEAPMIRQTKLVPNGIYDNEKLEKSFIYMEIWVLLVK